MTTCKYCDIYYTDSKMHQTSLIHATNEYNHCLIARKNGDDSDYIHRENIISDYKDRIEEGYFSCSKCDYECEDKDLMIKHEEKCLELKVRNTEPIFKCLTCEDCGYKIECKGQKFKPEYAMNRHKKSCARNKYRRMRKAIIEHINSVDDNKLEQFFTLMKQNS